MNEELQPQVDEVKAPKNHRGIAFLYELVSTFTTALVIIAIMFIFIFRFVEVDGSSMVPTLYDGNWLLVSAINEEFEQGDIIISTQPNAFNEPIVKRVIATSGQTVDIDFEEGIVYVDNVALDEPYVNEPTYTSEGISFPIVVPEGSLFVMGDNRNDSTDSRSPLIGCIDERYILGVVKYRVTPEFTAFN